MFDGEAVDAWSLGTTLFMALLGVQPWEEVGDYKFQAIAEGKNLEVVLQGWKLRHLLTQDAVDLLQVRHGAEKSSFPRHSHEFDRSPKECFLPRGRYSRHHHRAV